MVLATAKLFYFQQQVTGGDACSAASQTFALGSLQRACLYKAFVWQEGHHEEQHPLICEKAVIQ